MEIDSPAQDPSYDVFLSYHTTDKILVEILAVRLEDEAGLKPFLGDWHLIPGKPWQEALEAALTSSTTVAVFIGLGGLGRWQNEEMRAALEERVHNHSFRLIPVLLPGADPQIYETLPIFLRRLTWVDFRVGLDDQEAFHRLVAGIRGMPPDHPHSSIPKPIEPSLSTEPPQPYRPKRSHAKTEQSLLFILFLALLSIGIFSSAFWGRIVDIKLNHWQLLGHPYLGAGCGVVIALLSIFCWFTENPSQIPLQKILYRAAGGLVLWTVTWYPLSISLFQGLRKIPGIRELSPWPLAFVSGFALPLLAFPLLTVSVQRSWYEIFLLRNLAKILTRLSEKTFQYATTIVSREERKAGYDIETGRGPEGERAIDRLYERHITHIMAERALELDEDKLDRVLTLLNVNQRTIKTKLLLRHLGYTRLKREQAEMIADPEKQFPTWPSEESDRRRKQTVSFERRKTDGWTKETLLTIRTQAKDSD